MEKRPASVAALVHVVALHEVLRRQLRHLLTILELEPRLNDLREADSVARAARPLIPNRAHEVEAVNISEVIALRQLIVRDVLGPCIVLGPLLRLRHGALEAFS